LTDQQWDNLLRTIRGEEVRPLPVGFIIDSPWLPNWYGARILDYFADDELWLKSNLKALQDFPDVMFLPGFWSEFGMCTEPSAFGVRCTFPQDAFPHAYPTLRSADDIEGLASPNPRTDGLLPFVLRRLQRARPRIEAAGHKIRFAVARGPLNIASYLMGTDQFLMTMMSEPLQAEKLLKKITAFLRNWLELQRETFPTIDGIFLLDDIIGFIGEPQFRKFALPYFRELFDAGVSVKFLHNDASCKISAPFLKEMGVNMFSMGFDIPLTELRRLTGPDVTLVGNVPPRDVMAAGSPDDVARAVQLLRDSLGDTSRIVLSVGGGMPPGVTSENISAFVAASSGHAK
jgi:uroporphyrinogen decarboxylase